MSKTSTSITTFFLPLTILAGASVTDFITGATCTGTNCPTATGTISYKLFSGTSCSGTPLQTNIVTITMPGTFPNSDPFTINTVGTYRLQAIYSGDSLNLGSTGPCEGPVTVDKRTPTIATTLSSNSITVGTLVFDSVTLTFSTTTAGGTVKYQAFNGVGCVGIPFDTSNIKAIFHSEY